MIEKTSNIPDSKSQEIEDKPLIPVPVSAQKIHQEIIDALLVLENLNCESASDPDFVTQYLKVCTLYETYKDEILSKSEYTISCKKGCCACCNHWVEDVNSFEAEIIADYIIKNHTHSIKGIIDRFEGDMRIMEMLEKISLKKTKELDLEKELFDQIELLLVSFYRMDRPCPLLDKSGSCTIYEYRPLTCRIYMSFSDPVQCLPQYIDEGDVPTYILDFEESANEIFDRIHLKYVQFEGDSGLRTLLYEHLKNYY